MHRGAAGASSARRWRWPPRCWPGDGGFPRACRTGHHAAFHHGDVRARHHDLCWGHASRIRGG
ncbi:hypothetical protein Veis_1782 [Verminephrobacter eiseniae EF01-2]|uniref:Uncharacterized protein n=1 Tax=Verminephrobacter eiseniae (strain EF01-2) TaxID=391735 RepID=A1WIS9_VEREI|nr:hypothetical protein Veis_1782 [Verminephrobacter eiseniae EF01-2]